MAPTLQQGVFPASLQRPLTDDQTQPFWDAAQENRLVAPKCTNCGTFVLPPAPFCFNCQHTEFDWTELPGTATVYSFTVVRHPLAPMLNEVVPYASGVVDLDGTQGAGARLVVNFVGFDVEAVKVGDKGKIRFEKVTDEYAVPRFVPLD